MANIKISALTELASNATNDLLVVVDASASETKKIQASNLVITETDPVFTASAAHGITSTDITNWDTAYGGSFTNVTATGYVDATYYTEGVYNLTGTAIDPANGSVQYKTLAANTTFTESLADGDSVTLRISGGATYTVTWPTMTWVTSAGNTAPTLTAGDVVVLWQEGTTVYGAYVGSYV